MMEYGKPLSEWLPDEEAYSSLFDTESVLQPAAGPKAASVESFCMPPPPE